MVVCELLHTWINRMVLERGQAQTAGHMTETYELLPSHRRL